MKTNLSNLQQPPIVLERNALLLEVARLKGVVEQKEQDINLLKINLSKNGNLESSISQKDNVIKDLQNKLISKDSVLINQTEQIKVLQDKLKIVQSNSNTSNNLELNMLKEQLADKKSIIELIKNDNKVYKIKVEKLKTKLAEYTLNDISITHSEMLNNDVSVFPNEIGGEESIVLSGDVLQSFSIIEENNN